MRSSLIYVAIFLIFIGCSSGASNPPTEKADTNFSVYFVENSKGIPNFKNRSFGELAIFSNSNTFEERAHTALLAAKRYSEQEDLHFVRACHLPFNHEVLVGKGSCIAVAEYAPDGKGRDGTSRLMHGTWQASAVDGDIDDVLVLIEVLWYQMRDRYQKEDGLGKFIDEPALKQAIADKVGGRLSVEDIQLPTYNLKDL